MAEGWMRSVAGKEYDVYSAGTHPTTVNPRAILAMSEAGVDISTHTSNGVDEYESQTFDLVITTCDLAKQSCPVFPATTTAVNWSFDDPADAEGSEDERMLVFRRVRDEIRSEIEGYLANRNV